jgi:hypothetical protein
MGFNKRFLNKKNIINNVHDILSYLNVDAFYINDDFSYDVYRLYIEGKSEEEILNYINENKNED